MEKLKWLNKQYLQDLNTGEYVSLICDSTTAFSIPNNDKKLIEKSESIVKSRIRTGREYQDLAGFFHKRAAEYEMDLAEYMELLRQVVESLEEIAEENWKADQLGKILLKTAGKSGFSTGKFFMIIRVALTGKKLTPPTNESMEILGKEKTLIYLKSAIETYEKTSRSHKK